MRLEQEILAIARQQNIVLNNMDIKKIRRQYVGQLVCFAENICLEELVLELA